MTTDRGAIARAVAAAALGVPGVAQLTGGRGAVRAVTHYPGGTVTGVRLDAERVWVHIVAGRLPLLPLADEVHRAVRAELARMGGPRAVDLVIEDLDESALQAMLTGPRGRVLQASHGGLP